jgi:HEAT repeat protein
VKDYYRTLEVHYSARKEVIQNAYRTLVKIYHPDNLNGDEEIIKNINEAYEHLSDEIKRKLYDIDYVKIIEKHNKNTYNLELSLSQNERELVIKENEIKRREQDLSNREQAYHEKDLKNKKIDQIKKNLELKDKIKALGDNEIKENKKLSFLRDIVREGEKSLPLLVDAFQTGNEDVRFYVIQALGEIGTENELIIKALSDEAVNVRAEAAHTIGLLKIKGAAQYLIPLLIDTDSKVKKEACFAVCELGLTSAVPILREIISNKKETIDVKISAIKALGRCGEGTDIDIVSSFLKNKNQLLKESAENAMFILNQKMFFVNNGV